MCKGVVRQSLQTLAAAPPSPTRMKLPLQTNTFTLPAHHRSRHLSGERAGGDLSPLCGVDKGEVTSPSL